MPEMKEKRAFTVRFIRQGDSNEWEATIEPREGLEQANFTGFVSYSTAFWGREDPSQAKSAFVTILTEFDARPETKMMGLHAAVNEAAKLADLHFKQRHPSAVVNFNEFDVLDLL